MLQTVLVALLLAAGPQAQGKPKLLVLELNQAGGVDKAVASALTEALTGAVSSRGFFSVISSKDIQTMLGMERQRQQLGCKEDSSCLAELGGAVGARFILSGTLAKLGASAFQLTLQTIDTEKSQPIGRSTRMAGDVPSLTRLLPYAVAEASGQPPPPEPSRWPSYLMIGGGAVVGIAGGFVGVSAYSQEASIQRELEHQGILPTARAAYEAEVGKVVMQKNLSLAALLAGAAIAAGGVLLFPVDAQGGRVALAPSSNGVAVVGVWP